jgi:hypothetical protein
MGAMMWNLNWLSPNWRTQIFFALAGVIFVLCQFLVGSPPKIDQTLDSRADRGAVDGSFQELTTYFDTVGQGARSLVQESED